MAIQGHSRSSVSTRWDYILRHNNFGLIYEISKDIATTRNNNGDIRRHHSHLMPPVQRTPSNIGMTLISSQTRVSVHCATFRRW